MCKYKSTVLLIIFLMIVSILSLFVGVINLNPEEILHGDFEKIEILLISRIPRLLAILCTGIGLSVAGLIMQQLCMNKFVSPTTGATISSAQLGNLLALVFMANSTIWSRAIFAAVCAVLGTWVFVWFIQRIPFKDPVMVPLVAFSIGAASIVFQSIINNTIVTPCLLGMNSLYSLIHTVVAFFLGTGSTLLVNGNLSFAVDLLLMGVVATFIYSFIFKKTKYNELAFFWLWQGRTHYNRTGLIITGCG